MLSNAYFLAKFRLDTAEKEPAKNLQNSANFANSYEASCPHSGAGGLAQARATLAGHAGGVLAMAQLGAGRLISGSARLS